MTASNFRTWRRSRPFWGGLLLLIGGLEMLLIPLTGVLARGQVKLVIYVGIGGVFGILIGALLIACGLALWFTPVHKTFYAIAGVLLSLLSFIGTNLGGFFLGMLLGLVGGSLAFAWSPLCTLLFAWALGGVLRRRWRAGRRGRQLDRLRDEWHARAERGELPRTSPDGPKVWRNQIPNEVPEGRHPGG